MDTDKPNPPRNASPPLSRRELLLLSAATGTALLVSSDASQAFPAPADSAAKAFWWHRYPSFAQLASPDTFQQSRARMNIFGMASDPTWGPYAQRLTILEQGAAFKEIKKQGAKVITWIEGFGDCMLYAVALNRSAEGVFEKRKDDSAVALVIRSHWNWADPKLPKGDVPRWVGLHSTVNDEDYVLPTFGRLARKVPVPAYPDGRPALGWQPEGRYPLNARLYDACGAKDVNGKLAVAFECPANVNDKTAAGVPKGPFEGLYPATVGTDDVSAPGLKDGETAYSGVISVHKDLSAPFWREYARVSVREIVRQGVDGVWCDNYSPWDNFGYPPVRKAFGDWSVARFHNALRAGYTAADWSGIGVSDPKTFDVRVYLKRKATEFGAKDAANPDDPAWHDARWNDDPVWRWFKALRQEFARHDMQAFYRAIHEEADLAGRPDFCICGNDIPLYGLGWTRSEWLDMVSTELTPGWHMGSGSRGVLIPPVGKMAPVYVLAREHQNGPFVNAWYYLNGGTEKYQRKPEIGKVLQAEAFANGAFLMCDTGNKQVSGTLESHRWWNSFVRDHEAAFGDREPLADVGIYFSPDNQLALLTPGGFPDLDRQPHTFGYFGWATAMLEAHIPYRAITDWKLDQAHLHGLRVLVMPDAECLDDRAGTTLEAWVKAGGRLVLTGAVGVRRGVVGRFARRQASLVKNLIGGAATPAAPTARRIGRGEVIALADSRGMDYYLQTGKRREMLPEMRRMVGDTPLLGAGSLPETVGVSLWRSPDDAVRFVDLVNYDLNPDEDRLTPTRDMKLTVSVPKAWREVRAELLSPDGLQSVTSHHSDGKVSVRLRQLTCYASIRLTRTR